MALLASASSNSAYEKVEQVNREVNKEKFKMISKLFIGLFIFFHFKVKSALLFFPHAVEFEPIATGFSSPKLIASILL